MGIENPVHLLFIAVIALIVLGPKRLPALARAAGKGIREFRAALEGSSEGTAEQQPAALPPETEQPVGQARPPGEAG